MKKSIYILFSFISFFGNAQPNSNPSLPLVNTWQNVGNPGFSSGTVNYMCIAFNPLNNQPYVAYLDGNVSGKATVMRYDGNNWVNVGSPGFSAGVSQFISLAINPSGQPFVAYTDWGNLKKTTVMKFDGTNWINVGAPGFSIGEAYHMSLAFGLSGEPFVAYMDDEYSYRLVVKKFNGSNWVNVGNAGFTAGDALWINLAFNPVNSQPYVAYADYSSVSYGNPKVMTFDGTNWVYVGNQGLSPYEAAFTSIAFDSSGQPYVAFTDAGYYNKARVVKFNGTNWIDVGNPGFSPSLAMFTTLAFNPTDGIPYVAYIDYSNAQEKASLMKLNGTNWEYVGNGGFYIGATWSLDFAFSPSGIPYVSFMDSVYSSRASVMKYDTMCSVPPIPTINGSENLCINSGLYNYSTETGMNGYQWSISPGGAIITGQGTSVVQVEWNQAGNQWIDVNYTNNGGCTAINPTNFPVTVNPLPDSAGAINGSSVVCAGSNEIIYTLAPVVNAITYVWTLPAGAMISSGSGTNEVIISFAYNASSGNITVYGNNLCGNGTISPPFHVIVNPIPVTPAIIEDGNTLISSAPIGNQWFYNGILLANDTNQSYNVSPYLPGYYWTQVTIEGCVSDTSNHIYCNTTGFKNNINSGLTLYPNPATTNLIIENSHLNSSIVFIEIYTAGGEKVFETQISQNRFIINIENYPKGVYVVKLKTDESNYIEKIIKN